MDEHLWKEFKRLTGYNQSDISERMHVSKRHISQIKSNTSLTYKTSFAFMLNTMIDLKIHDLHMHICWLEDLKQRIISDAVKEPEESDQTSNI